MTSFKFKIDAVYIKLFLNVLIWKINGVYPISEVQYNLMYTDLRINSILSRSRAASVTSCAEFCTSTNTCNAFNIASIRNSDRTRACEAIRLDFISIQSAVQETGWNVYTGKTKIC